jgi:hypothetical protein
MKLLASKLKPKAFKKARTSTVVCPVEFGTYVIFTIDDVYEVGITKNSVGDDLVECDCRAAEFGNSCYHAAAAYKKHLMIARGAHERNLIPSLLDQDYLLQAEWLN